MSIAYIFNQDGSISGVAGCQSFTVQSSHPNYQQLKTAILDNDEVSFKRLLNVAQTIKEDTNGSVSVVDGNVVFNGKTIHHVLTQRMLEHLRSGYGVNPILRFLSRLMQNPSNNSTEQLCRFLENKCLPITEDGFFLAYKTVRSDYYDKYTGKILNKVGCKPSMPRNEISDDPHVDCGKGLHAGALHYAGPQGWYHSGGEHVMIVKIDPANVVSVPHDHSCGKLRTCAYEVISEYQGELNKPVYTDKDELRTYEEVDVGVSNEEMYDVIEYIEDIYVGDEISFDYHDKPRRLLVDKVMLDKGLVSGSTPDGYRAFTFDEMVNPRYINYADAS